MIISVQGDIWQPDMTCLLGPNETSSCHISTSLVGLMKDYELRHGRCSSFTIKVIK